MTSYDIIKQVMIAPTLAWFDTLADYSFGRYDKKFQGKAQLISLRRIGNEIINDEYGEWIKEYGFKIGDTIPVYEVEILLAR